MRNLLTITLLALAMLANGQTDKSLARVEQMQGLYIFSDCKPVAEYEYLGTSVGAGGGGAGLNPQYNVIRDRMILKVKKEYPEANGIILHLNPSGRDVADAIKFKP